MVARLDADWRGNHDCDSSRVRRRPGHREFAATVTEFALVLPIIVAMASGLVDFGRAVYINAAMSALAPQGARAISLRESQTSDCPVLQQLEHATAGFGLQPDPNSLSGNSDPNNPSGSLKISTPPPGVGYIYVWPAVAATSPQDVAPNCKGLPRAASGTSRQVAVVITYHFVAWTPYFAAILSNVEIQQISVVQTEY